MKMPDIDISYLTKVKDRVHWIYSNSQDAVNNNSVLVKLYEKYFETPSESVTRAGRFWRSEKAKDKVFTRDEAKVERDLKLFDLNREFWRKEE